MSAPVIRVADVPPELLAKLDALLWKHLTLQAIKMMWDELVPRPSLGDAQEFLAQRSRDLGVPNEHRLPPPELGDLVASLCRTEPRPVAIEASWDGDTHGWFVVVEAILPLTSRAHARYTAKHIFKFTDVSGDMRVLRGTVPPWPEAQRAATFGAELARRLGVPFHFASPDVPNDEAPRWWDTTPRP